MIGRVESTGLMIDGKQACMAAGLPHFSTHHMRCWGRDTFISFTGMFLIPKRFSEAREHLIAYASCLYHGLIPNLLDSCRRPRYNSRDTTWWFLFALQNFVQATGSEEILHVEILLRFPNAGTLYVDWTDPLAFSESITMLKIVQAIMSHHVKGIHFRESGAGELLDAVMQEAGFNIDIYLDKRLGFLIGGNSFNCGTWMDKMGESSKAGNYGVPSTPRDGAPIELVSLLWQACTWLASFYDRKGYEEIKGVQLEEDDGRIVVWTYLEWANLIKDNFEKLFWLPCRKIYRDVVHSSNPDHEIQFRPNQIIAMWISPSLFNVSNAKSALHVVESVLVGPLGLRTLDPNDPSYRPVYDPSDENEDFYASKGFNYHNGPEWIWLMGPYIASHLNFFVTHPIDSHNIAEVNRIRQRLAPHESQIKRSMWKGLPELTNRDGAECPFACQTQAWSMACLAEVVLMLDKFEAAANSVSYA